MLGKIYINENHRKKLKKISNFGPQELKKLIEKLSLINSPITRPVDLKLLFTTQLGSDKGNLLYRSLMSISVARREKSLSAKELISSITLSLAKCDWNTEELAQWDKICDDLIQLLDLDVINLSTKILDLTYDYDHLFDKARILTDIRPVFSDHGDKIISAIVSHTLRIGYFNQNGSQEISAMMEEGDIELLKQTCERALNKSKNTKKFIEEQCSLRIITPGDEYYEE